MPLIEAHAQLSLRFIRFSRCIGAAALVLLAATAYAQTTRPLPSSRPHMRKAPPKRTRPMPRTRALQRPTSAPTKGALVRLSGTLRSLDGGPIAAGEVVLARRWFPQESVKAKVDSKGRWHLNYRAFGVYQLSWKAKGHKRTSITLMLVEPRRIQVDVGLVKLPAKATPKPKQRLTPKRALPQRVEAPKKSAKPPKRRAPTLEKKPMKPQRPKLVIRPWREGTIHRLLKLRRKMSRAAFRGSRRYRKAGHYSFRYRHNWKPFLAQVRGALMVEKSRHKRHALMLLRRGLRNYRPPYKQRKANALRLSREIAPRSPAWEVRSSSIREVFESYWVKKLPRGKRLMQKFLGHHPNPGLRFHVYRKLLISAFYNQMFTARRFKNYHKARAPFDALWHKKIASLLNAYKGKSLNAARQKKLQGQLSLLLREHFLALIQHKKLKRFHASSYYLQKLANLMRDPKHYLHKADRYYQEMKAIARLYPSKKFTKLLKRGLWKIHPSYKLGYRIPSFKMTLLPSASHPKPRSFATSDLQGRRTLLIFWATWCGPCKRKLPLLHKIHKEYGPKGLRMVSISIDKKPARVHAFRKGKWPIPWDNVILSTPTQRKMSDVFEVSSIPRMFLVGPKGRLIATHAMLRGKGKLTRALKQLKWPVQKP